MSRFYDPFDISHYMFREPPISLRDFVIANSKKRKPKTIKRNKKLKKRNGR